MTLAWDPSTDPDVAGYKIYYGVVSRTYTNMVDVGNATNVTISGLIEGTTYYFAATAYNALGMESDFSNETSYSVPTSAVNNSPTLNALSNLTISEDAPLQTINLTGISSGASNEVQTLTVSATSSNPSLIPNPTVNYTSPNATGTLTFTPVFNANGTADISVTVNDGGTTNNTFTRTFTVSVNAVNDPPTLTALSNVTISEDAALQTVNLAGISSGASNEVQTLTVTATSSNPSLIPNPTVIYTSPNATGSLTFMPAANATGSAVVTVTVDDGGATNNTVSRTFTVTVNAVNDPPTLDPLTNLTINEDAGLQTVSLSGISSGAANESQTLTVTATSSNPGLIPNPTVTYTTPNATGSLAFTPVANANGIATLTVTVNDGQATSNTVTRTFTVTVNAVNDSPTLNALSNLTISEDAPLQTINLTGISSGASNEVQALTLTAISSNPGLIPNPTVNYTSPNATGNLTFTPAANANGLATVTVTVNDGQASSNTVSRSFTVTVNAVNDTPTLNPLNNLTVNKNAGLQTINLAGISSGAANESQTLTVTAISSNPSLIPNPTVTYTTPNATGSLTFTPVANAVGSATLTVTVNDGGTSNNVAVRTFTVTVNQPPTITAIPKQIIATNTNTGAILFSIGDLETPASNLVVWATSSAPTLIPTNNIVFGGNDSNRTVTITPLLNQNGNADITITVSDGIATASTTFQVSVLAPPSPPSMLTIVTNGGGSVTPAMSSQDLVLGQTYTFTAVPATGQRFAGWSGSLSSSSPTVTFVLTSNFVLQANFVPSSLTPAKNRYSGLFYENDEVRQNSAGFLTLATTTRGTYSGRLQMGANRYAFSGQLNLQGQATNHILRPTANPLTVELQIGTGSQADQVFGRVTDGTWVSPLLGNRDVFSSRTNPAPYAGSYTLRIPGQDNNPSVPTGDGFGTVRVDTKGRAKFVGVLADGTKVSQSVSVSRHGLWPLYVALYSGQGSAVSWLTFTNQPNSDLSGAFSWIKPAGIAPYYPNGFSHECQAVGSLFVAPVGITQHILNLTDASVLFSGGNLAADFTNLVTLEQNSRVSNRSSNPLTMSFSLTTGTFKGTAVDPASGASLKFSGVVLQKVNAGCGFLLGTSQSSRVVLAP
ncbi:MAG: tandem-95 repeat protein [Verrucomicrobia bacterium]|nr:tandem-95 repeat protein [Verrucomicrobiota bacterium]